MTAFRTLTDRISVSPQILPKHVALAAEEGFTLIINNRPEGESPDQPAGAEIEAAARAAGLDYIAIPIVGRPGPAQVEAMRSALAEANGKVLAFCRSGTRSATVWAMGADEPRDEILGRCLAVGYDLSGVLA